MNKILSIILSTALLSCFFGCDNASIREAEQCDEYPSIFPDYIGVTAPVNIAPMNFRSTQRSKIHVEFKHQGKTLVECAGNPAINIPRKQWSKLLKTCAGSSVDVQVYILQDPGSQETRGSMAGLTTTTDASTTRPTDAGATTDRPSAAKRWVKYKTFAIAIAADSTDEYLTYRLIAPGYERWGEMGIYQRQLSSFAESTVIDNKLIDNGCVNCHSFADYDARRMMFHARGKHGATFISHDGQSFTVDTKTEHAASTGSYPAWHPSGRYIAFACGVTRQAFHAMPGKKVEVYDLESNLMIFDVEAKKALLESRFNTKEAWETFPGWSPDGRALYFCSADARNMPFEYKELKYGLYRAGFDPETGRLSAQIDTLVDPVKTGKSVSFPRVSPDGKYLLYTETASATFPIWHSEADLQMIELASGENIDISAINSADTESYHSWSSNGSWIVFSSRRLDGLHTRLFLAHFDSTGRMHKPLLLPQKDPDYNTVLLKSYNVPEFCRARIELSPYEIAAIIRGKETAVGESLFK